MNEEKSYLVSIRPPDGLQMPRGKDAQTIVKSNAAAVLANYRNRMLQLTQAGVLEGITVLSESEYLSSFGVMGPDDKIQVLQNFIEGNDIGTVADNCDVY